MRAIIALAGLACLLAACGPRTHEQPPTFSPQRKASRAMPLSRPAAEAARLLQSERFELRDMEPATGGVTRVDHGEAYFPARGVELDVKWKVAPAGGEGWNNVPRKEVAAFVIQQWFLDDRDWIVPPTAIRCVPVEAHRRFLDAEPIVENTRCVLGMIAAWLDDVEHPAEVLDEDRFRREPEYARHRADLNLVAYLIAHRDGRLANFLVPEDDDDGRIYLIDNGISFGGLVWNYFRPNWNVIRVPALRRDSVDRLRRVSAGDVSALAVLTQLEADPQGVLQPAKREGPWDASQGARLQKGRAQFGLTADEIAGVTERLEELLSRVDGGEIGLF
jgi:hypothetical protein